MRPLPSLCCVVLLALAGSGTAEAACEITDTAPTGVLPTTSGQPFTFVATSDCTMLSFIARGGSITRTPRPGMMLGAGARRYSVSLTAAEWSSVASSSAIQLIWVISGQFAGSTTRVPTVSDLDFDGDGWTRREGDEAACDLDVARNPGEREVCDNGVDDDCDGTVDRCTVPVTDADLLIESRDGSTSPYQGIGGAVAIGDLDADGEADLLLGVTAAELAHVVYGPASGVIDASSGSTLMAHQPGGGGFGAATSVGDANDDGLDDALVGAPYTDTSYLFLGPITASRATREADAQLVGRENNPRDDAGSSVLVGTDHDGDGQSDIAVGAVLYLDHDGVTGGHTRGAVYVISGSVAGEVDLEAEATYVYLGAGGADEFGTRIDTVSDWNGDGLDELAISATRGGEVAIIDGGGTPGRYYVDDIASATIGGPDVDSVDFGVSLAAGDYDGDGAADVLVGAPSVLDFFGERLGRIRSFSGPVTGRVAVGDADTTWEGEQGGVYGSRLGQSVAVGDADGDGASDVLMGDTTGGPDGLGAVYLQLGPATGTHSVASLLTFASAASDGLGASVGFVPDWTGDGNPELLFGAPSATDASATDVGAVYSFFSDSLFP